MQRSLAVRDSASRSAVGREVIVDQTALRDPRAGAALQKSSCASSSLRCRPAAAARTPVSKSAPSSSRLTQRHSSRAADRQARAPREKVAKLNTPSCTGRPSPGTTDAASWIAETLEAAGWAGLATRKPQCGRASRIRGQRRTPMPSGESGRGLSREGAMRSGATSSGMLMAIASAGEDGRDHQGQGPGAVRGEGLELCGRRPSPSPLAALRRRRRPSSAQGSHAAVHCLLGERGHGESCAARRITPVAHRGPGRALHFQPFSRRSRAGSHHCR